MILYNVTVNIEKDVELEWLHWMHQVHIPKVLATGLFKENKMYRLLNETENDDSTYSIQYFAKSIDDIQLYLDQYAPALVNEHLERYKYKHVAFRTLLEEVKNPNDN